MKKRSLANIVAFCSIMESNGGIVDKSPDYIAEKFVRYCMSGSPDEWKWGLDSTNGLKLIEWMRRWRIGKDNYEQVMATGS